MREALINRGGTGKNTRWAIVVDGDFFADPKTGKQRRKQKWISFKGTRDDAKAKRDEILHAKRTGTYVQPATTTVLEYVRGWREKFVKPPMRRASTYRVYGLLIEQHVGASDFANLPLQELRTSDLERFYATMKVAPATTKVIHAILHRALKRAVKDRLLAVNPATGAEFDRAKSDQKAVREHCWSAHEARLFIAEAKKASPQVAAYFALLLDTGARKSEANGLTWDRVDLGAGTIMVDRQLDSIGKAPDYVPVFGPTKTKAIRTVALGPETLALLKTHKQTQAALKLKNRTSYQDHGLVFAREPVDQQTPHAKLGQALDTLTGARYEALIKAAGVKRIKPHGLRHTAITLSLAAGVPVHVVARRVGHTDASMTLNVYAHALPDQNAAAAKTLAGVLHGSPANKLLTDVG